MINNGAPFGSAERLAEHIEHMFDCAKGDPRAYHSVWVENSETGSCGYIQFPYTVLGLIAPDTIPEAQERLRQVIYTALFKLKVSCKSERPKLYWRRTVEESSDPNPLRYKITIRIAIPEADFSVCDGLVLPDGVPCKQMKD